jgi:hypothetical protein
MSENKGGDVLARGNVRCTFQPAGSKVSQKKWDKIWDISTKKAPRKNRKS